MLLMVIFKVMHFRCLRPG